jgi:hypothetical protein
LGDFPDAQPVDPKELRAGLEEPIPLLVVGGHGVGALPQSFEISLDASDEIADILLIAGRVDGSSRKML